MAKLLTLLTAVTSVVSCIIAVLSLRQNSKMIYNQGRAMVKVQFKNRYSKFYICVKNYGKSPALIEEITMDPTFTKEELGDFSVLYDGNPLKDLNGSYFMPSEVKWAQIPYPKNKYTKYKFVLKYSDTKFHIEEQILIPYSSNPFGIGLPDIKNSNSAQIHIAKNLEELTQHDLFKD